MVSLCHMLRCVDVPQVGEKVWVRLYTDKSGRFAVSMDVDDEMRRASKAATEAR